MAARKPVRVVTVTHGSDSYTGPAGLRMFLVLCTWSGVEVADVRRFLRVSSLLRRPGARALRAGLWEAEHMGLTVEVAA